MTDQLKYSENDFVNLLTIGGEKEFSILYDNYSKALYGIITNLISEEKVAEEILQDVFIKIWSNRLNYDTSKGRLFTWMLNIARNSSIDYLRSKTNKMDEKNHKSANVISEINKIHSVETPIDHIGLKNVLTQLSDEQQKLINLVYFKGYTQEELSKKLNIPLGTVKTRVRTALITLRQKIN